MENIDINKLENILKFFKYDNIISSYKIFEKKYESINKQLQTENFYEKTQLIEEYILNNNIFDEIIKNSDNL